MAISHVHVERRRSHLRTFTGEDDIGDVAISVSVQGPFEILILKHTACICNLPTERCGFGVQDLDLARSQTRSR